MSNGAMSGVIPRSTAPHRWWAPDVDDERRPSMLFEHVRAVEERQGNMRMQMFRNAYMYTGEQISGIRVDWRQRPVQRPEQARINITESLIETAHARIASREPRIAITTRGGSWDLRQRARGLEQYIDGTFVETAFIDAQKKTAKNAFALGSGFTKIYSWHDKPRADAIFPLEVIVDEEEALTDEPMQIAQRRFPDVDAACAEFPDFEDDIWKAASARQEPWVSYMTYQPHRVPIIEGWRKPSRPGGDDGMHVVCINQKILLMEPWERDYLPFIHMKWADKMLGYYGRGIPETIYWLAARLNRHASFEAACQDRFANPRVLVDQADEGLSESMTNEIGVIIPWRGRSAPVFVNPPAVPPEIYRDEDRKMGLAYKITGIDDFQRPGGLPPGVDSKPAIQEWVGYNQGRFAIIEQRHDQCFVKGAQMLIDEQKALSGNGRSTKVTWNSVRYGLLELDWSEVNMERDIYRMRVLPASSISNTPAGLRQRLEEERAAGRMPDDIYRYLVQTLDVEQYYSLYDAAVSNIMRQIEQCIDPKKPFPSPNQYQALDLGLYMFQMEYNKAEALGAPQSVLRRLDAWMSQAEFVRQSGGGVMLGQAPQLGPAQAGGGPSAPQQASLGTLPMAGMGG